MGLQDALDLPFFEDRHRGLASKIDSWARAELGDSHPDDVDSACRDLVARLGSAGFLDHAVARDGGDLDVRSLSVTRSILAYHSGLADFAFAMQGLGSGAISLFGSEAQRMRWLPPVAEGKAIAAFAMTEPGCGSDAARIAMTATRDGSDWLLDGEKTYISNGGIADFYLTFARSGEAEGARGLSAFIVPADRVELVERIEVLAPHPLARLRFDSVRLGPEALVGNPGEGFRIAMETLNRFRVTVGAAALGFARRALHEALDFSSGRALGDGTLADHPVTRDRIAGMYIAVESSELAVARAAWEQDRQSPDARRFAALAKLHSTEAAQKVIDAAVQMHGGAGVTRGVKVEELYREIRALRIYEGASEVQRQIIGRDLVGRRTG